MKLGHNDKIRVYCIAADLWERCVMQEPDKKSGGEIEEFLEVAALSFLQATDPKGPNGNNDLKAKKIVNEIMTDLKKGKTFFVEEFKA